MALFMVVIVAGASFAGAGVSPGVIAASLAVGGIPCAIGVAMVWLGRLQIRLADREARDRVQSDVFD